MLYHLYELNQAALTPARAAADVYRLLFRNFNSARTRHSARAPRQR
jgi:poly-beta-hydroxyalkanoate depolymerase